MKTETKYLNYIEKRNALNNIKNDYNIKLGFAFSTEIFDSKVIKKKFFKKIISPIVFKNILNLEKNKNSRFLLSYGCNLSKRKDYEEMLRGQKEILKKLGGYDYLTQERRKIDYKFIWNILLYFRLFFKYKKKFSLINSLNYSALELEVIKYYKMIEKIISFGNYKGFFTFCDAHAFDNLLTQIGKERKIKTFTMQHGVYFNYETDDKPVHTITLENFISDYMLSFGQHTVDQAKKLKISKDRLLKVGPAKNILNPKKIILKDIKKKNYFLLILDNNSYIKSNIEMIKIANEISKNLNLKYILRMHPSNNFNDYNNYLNEKNYFLDKSNNLKQLVDLVDFGLLHITTMYIELLELGLTSFVYKDDYNNVKIALTEKEFKSKRELLERIEKIETSKIKIIEEINYFIEPGKVKENYIKSIKEVLE